MPLLLLQEGAPPMTHEVDVRAGLLDLGWTGLAVIEALLFEGFMAGAFQQHHLLGEKGVKEVQQVSSRGGRGNLPFPPHFYLIRNIDRRPVDGG